MEWITGAAVLEFAGITAPSSGESSWADAVAGAVNAGVDQRLNGATVPPEGVAEVTTAALMAGGEAFKRRSAPFGVTGYSDITGTAIRVARDYLEGVRPLLDRWAAGPGIG